MSRRASIQQSIHFPHLITPRIIQGRFTSSDYPGPAIFAANRRELAGAYRLSRGRPRLLAAARLFGAVESQGCTGRFSAWRSARLGAARVEQATSDHVET